MEYDTKFSVDVALDEVWLKNALETVKQNKPVRITVVISDHGPKTKYRAEALGGGDAEFMVVAAAGDITKEKFWRGDD